MSVSVTKRVKIARSPLLPDFLRRCSGCKQDLSPSAFTRCQKNKDGLHSYCRECRSAAKKADYASRAPEFAVKHRIKTYGLAPAAFAGMVERQQNCCAICHEEMGEGHNRHIDHDHATGRVRELLCSNCNRALGGARDNPDLLRAMAAYVERHR